MGACLSSPEASSDRGGGGMTHSVSERDKALHRQAEKALKDAKAKQASEVKVLLLGSGDSGKSTILKQMRLIHRVPFSAAEIESYRQLVFENLVRGLRYLLEALEDLGLELPEEYDPPEPEGRRRRGASLKRDVEMVEHAEDIRDGEPFPVRYFAPLTRLWKQDIVRTAWARGNEAAIPENLHYFFSDLPRLFDPAYVPTEQDIVRTRARTIGITETTFALRGMEMLMVDLAVTLSSGVSAIPRPGWDARRGQGGLGAPRPLSWAGLGPWTELADGANADEPVGGQKSERRKWIHCFQDVTSILFLVSLSGYDQCLVEDRDANQMQDAMTIWDSICHSQWFKQTSIILFLNKDDLFEQKIPTSDLKNFFPDFDGESGNAQVGREYFKKRFGRLAQKAGRAKDREIYIHITTATDTEMLRVVMTAVEE
ncbi:hypothetical protein MSAN_02037700 [Mycena sanguinolenta]|uniref:Uncharacterized protein n=1 Tax=Mycena sanguinolenta TaxID=230812 RepID=A0A8H6XK63_9AGAR|nr:hypothetical protein MSAN_02037700 [Mycena sanguinolenta]